MTARRSFPSPRLRGDGGAVLVEAALVMPVLLLMMLGLTEYSIAEFQSSQASSGARDGARVGILDYKQADVPGSDANDAVVAAVNARLAGQKGVTVTVTCVNGTGTTIACNTAVADRDRLQVRVSWPYRKITGILPVTPTTISSTSRMALVGEILPMSTTTSTPTSSSSTSSTSTSSTSSTTSTTSTTTAGCTIATLRADNGTANNLPEVNDNSHNLMSSLLVYFTATGTTCRNFVVTVWPSGAGVESGGAVTSPNGVSFNAASKVYTAIYNKTDKGINWSSGPVLIRVSSTTDPLGGTTDLVVDLPPQ